MSKMPEMAGLIDLTSIKRPPEVDIYLCVRACSFMETHLVLATWPTNLEPQCFFRSVPYAHVRPNSLNQITPLKDTATNKILSLKEIFDKDLSNVFCPIPYNRKKSKSAKYLQKKTQEQ